MSNFTHTGVLSLPLVLSLQSSGQKRGVLRHSHMRLPVYPPAFRLANFRDCRTSETLLFHQCFLITEKREPTYVGEQKRARFISYPKMVPAFKISFTWVVHLRTRSRKKHKAINVVPGHCWSFFQGLDVHCGATCPSLPGLTEVTQGEGVLPGVMNVEAGEPTTDKSKVFTKLFSLVLLPFLEEFSWLNDLPFQIHKRAKIEKQFWGN